jgi:heme/copper-type cytochrome/quinol oxidase subunit 3
VTTDPAEFLPPPLSRTWKAGLAAFLVAAALVFTGTTRTLYTYAFKGLGSATAPPSDRITVTLWKVTYPAEMHAYGGAPGYRVPLMLAGVLLVMSAVALPAVARRPAGHTAARMVMLVLTALLGGVVWAVFINTSYTRRQLADYPGSQILFDFGDALWFLVIGTGLAIVGSVLVLTRAVGPAQPAGPMVYRIPAGEAE